MESKSYKLRVSLKDVSVDQAIRPIQDCEHYAYVVEGRNTTNPHMHFFLRTSVKEATIRDRYRKLGVIGGNRLYSLTQLTQEDDYPVEYLGYLTKEGDVTWHNIPKEKIDAAYTYNAKVAKELLEKKKAKRPMVEILEEYVRTKGVLEGYFGDDLKVWIAKYIVEYHLENKMLIRRFAILAYVDTIYLRLAGWDGIINGWVQDLIR